MIQRIYLLKLQNVKFPQLIAKLIQFQPHFIYIGLHFSARAYTNAVNPLKTKIITKTIAKNFLYTSCLLFPIHWNL